MELHQIVNLVKSYEDDWTRRGQWQKADLPDAVAFLATEAGEALSEAMRIKGGYVRNDQRNQRLADELADVLMMLLISADRADIDLTRALCDKLRAMDAKRDEQGVREA